MDAREDIHSEATRLGVLASWQASQTTHVPLALAASFALFELSEAESLELPASSFEYLGSLNVMAAALSSLIPLYAQRPGQHEPVAVTFDPVRQRFEGGARTLRGSDGTLISDLSVSRADVLAAMPAIERARPVIPLSSAARVRG